PPASPPPQPKPPAPGSFSSSRKIGCRSETGHIAGRFASNEHVRKAFSEGPVKKGNTSCAMAAMSGQTFDETREQWLIWTGFERCREGERNDERCGKCGADIGR